MNCYRNFVPMKNHQPPHELTDVGLSMFVDTVKLRELPLPVVEIPLEELIWHFDMPVWAKDGTEDWNLTPWQVIHGEKGSDTHQKRVAQADTIYPIIVTPYKDRLVILDGVHRLVKTYQSGYKTIKAKMIPEEYLLLPEYQSE